MSIDLKGMTPLLQVFDMNNSLSFYRDKIGFQIIQSAGNGNNLDWVLLKLNDVEIMLNTAFEWDNRPDSPDPLGISHHADTALYFGCPDIEEAYINLKAKGLDLEKPIITQYGWKAIYLDDPDGYKICIHWPI
jgi:catechol 2,3-dioxygenase-like lactoylglutathione lyase family enzyme